MSTSSNQYIFKVRVYSHGPGFEFGVSLRRGTLHRYDGRTEADRRTRTMAASSSEDGSAVLSATMQLAAALEEPLRELPAHGVPAQSVVVAAAALKAKDPYVHCICGD